MAKRVRYDKLVIHDAVWAATNIKQRLVQCLKVDADSVPAAYCKSFKISVSDNTSENSNLAYSFYAMYDEDTVFSANHRPSGDFTGRWNWVSQH